MTAAQTPTTADELQRLEGSNGRVLADLLGRNPRRVAELTLASVLSGLVEAGVLAIVAQVGTNLATGSHRIDAHIGPAHIHSSVGVFLAIAGALAVVRLGLQVPTSIIPARIASDVQADLRRSLLASFLAASWSNQASDREGHFQELMGSQIHQSSQSAVQATTLVTNIAAVAVLLASAVVLNPVAAGIVLVVSVVLFALLRPLSAAGKRAAANFSRAQLSHAAGVSEVSRLAEETQVFGAAGAQQERIGALIDRSRAHFFRTQVLQRFVPGAYQSLIYLLLVGGLAFIEHVVHGSIASLGAVVLLLVRAGSYGNQVQNSYQSLKQSLPFLENVRSAATEYRASAPARGRKPLSSIETIAFEDVGYSYGRARNALEHVTFTVTGGEAIGIVGPSGSGKSTLAQILLRLREPTTGAYLVNGTDADEYRDRDWQQVVAYVPQTPQLIHASASENIRFYRDLPQAEVERAARLAGIHDEIVAWRQGYDTIVGPRADAVSGGQAQRICLARAIVGRPKLLLLDEPTSSVDLNSERIIQDSLLALKREVTLFVIAHRISTLDMCDRVIVVLDGKLDAVETFSRLRESNQYYRTVGALVESPSVPG